MKCGKCGTELPPNSSHCPICGNQTAGNTYQPQYQAQTPYQPQYQAQTPYQPQSQQVPQGPVNTWLVPAVLATLFCCLPFGIVSIVFASKANSALSSQDYQLASENAAKAKTWFWVAFGCGIVSGLIQVLMFLVGSGN